MPRAFGTIRVTAIPGEPFRFHVEGSKPGETYMVDLEARYPLGACFCQDYQCRRWPDFKKTLKPVRCKHLIAARESFCNRVIKANSKQLRGDGE